MCGRYNIIASAQGLYDAFHIIGEDLDFSFVESRYNVHPSPAGSDKARWVRAPIIRKTGDSSEALPAVWPLIPKWAKGQVPKYSTANAKAETVASAKSYQYAWKNNQRCLIPASGFYEWQAVQNSNNKQPYHIKVSGQALFAMAGIWEQSTNMDTQDNVISFSILTTQANQLMARIHNTNQRMPVILAAENYQRWLDVTPDEAQRYCQPYPAEGMTAYKISTYVNNPNHDDEKCIEALPQDK